MSKIESLASASPSEVHPGGKFQEYFACTFYFRQCPRLLVPVETMDPFLLDDNSFKTAKQLVDYV